MDKRFPVNSIKFIDNIKKGQKIPNSPAGDFLFNK